MQSASMEEITKHFCAHLVGLGWYEGKVNRRGQFSRTPTFYGASGFLLQPHPRVQSLCLVTAGHVLTEHDERKAKGNVSQFHSLFDTWGPASTCPERIPFDFTNVPALYQFDESNGLDYAVITLPGTVVEMLLQTTVPVRRRDWLHQPEAGFDFYAMLGLPNELAEQSIGKDGVRNTITTTQCPALLLLERCDLPGSSKVMPNRQFAGRVLSEAPTDIIGMSGGPIFGFRSTDEGLRYWPVAVQSRWRRKERIVIGTSLRVVASSIEDWCERFLSEQ